MDNCMVNKGKIFFPLWDKPQQRFFEFLNLNNFAKIIFFSKMILVHGSGFQENQFDEKKMEAKNLVILSL